MPDDNKADWDLLHTNLHALRMIPNYKPTEFEKKVVAMIMRRYKNNCIECRDAEIRLQSQPQGSTKSFMDRFFNG